jgi:hypothetical protein
MLVIERSPLPLAPKFKEKGAQMQIDRAMKRRR